MKILLRIAVIAAVAALAAGCCKCRSYQKKNRRPLVGTEWQLVQLNGRAVKPQEGKFNLTFLAEENRFAGVGACNRLMGKYETTDKGALRIGPIASTMMACPGMEQEDAFTKDSFRSYLYSIPALARQVFQGLAWNTAFSSPSLSSSSIGPSIS